MDKLIRLNRKAQVWSMDFIFGLLIFIAVAIIAVPLVYELFAHNNLETLQKESLLLSDALMSEGYPNDWPAYIGSGSNGTADSAADGVIRPGIITGGRLDTEKLIALKEIGYENSKKLFNIMSSDYYFIIRDDSGSVSIPGFGCGFGHSSAGYSELGNCFFSPDNLSYENLVSVERAAAFHSRIWIVSVYVWN
ncbi:MAG: hypothetical protein V1659_05810 [Candidatus Woesearchaeota archaeon]